MITRLSINGFGRIGRLILRALIESKRTDIQIIAINATMSSHTVKHLLQYDSVHGILKEDIVVSETLLQVGSHKIKLLNNRNPAKLNWGDLGIDVVAECTGVFNSKEKSSIHLKSGAKRVLISAPADDADITVVYGVNDQEIKSHHRVISNASCTTNCLAPLACILDKEFEIETGFMQTIHSYTGDQNTIDAEHRDLQRARAAGLSMIPTSTGAAKAIGLILPNLQGKIAGTSVRVPTPNVSFIDFTCLLKKQTSAQDINQKIIEASRTHPFDKILFINSLPLVSIDFNHNPYSSIFNTEHTLVNNGKFARISAWYDNEWGFSNRMLDTAATIAKTI